MSYAKKTLADLKISLADKHDSGTLPTDSTTLAYWTRLLNQGIAYCADQLRLTKSTSLTTASGTIVLPDDFIFIDKVVNSEGVQLLQIDKEDADTAEGLVFWITGNHLNDFYLNTPDNETYTVWYAFRPSELSSNSDEVIIPDAEAVVQFAYSKLRKAETDPLEDADAAMADCNRRLDEIKSHTILNQANYGFTLPSARPQTWWEAL